MTFKVTAKTRSILNQIQKNPSVLIDVEGIDNVFSSSVVFERILWDNDNNVTWDTPGATWDGAIASDKYKGYINLKDSTRAIKQQIYPDKKGSSSISTIRLSIIDKNGEVSKTFARNKVNEILGKKCTVNLGFVGAVYPVDFMPLMNGIITNYSYKGGSVQLSISHADTLRRQAILSEYNSVTTFAVTSSQTTIPVKSTVGFLETQDILTSFIKIDDEIMQVVSVDSETQFTVLRGELGTLEESHDSDADIVSVFQLKEFPLTLAQKIMQSDGKQTFFESDIPLLNFQYVSPVQDINNAIIFDDVDIKLNTGLIENDIIEIDTHGQFTIKDFGVLDDGTSYIIVNENLTTIVDVQQSWRFKSQYNVLNFGLGMQCFEVDNQEFEDIKTTFTPNFTEMTFRFDSGIDNARDFINDQLFFVSGCYGIPRNARQSIRFLAPPLTISDIPVLNETNVNNLISLQPMRSVNTYYYNDVLYAFNKSIRDGKYKSFSRFIDDDSKDAFQVGLKQKKFVADGLIRANETDIILNRLASRFLARYSGAAVFIKGVELSLKTGFALNTGDVLIFGGSGTKLPDYDTGLRNLPIGKYEIINMSINLSGNVKVDLLSTGYSITGTFGVFSPSSRVLAGSNVNELILGKISNLDEYDVEREKWENLIGAKIRVRSEDYLYDETTRINGFSLQNPQGITIDALTVAPPENAILELANYDEYETYGATQIDDLVKLKYTFAMNQDDITSGDDDFNFDIANPGDFFEGQVIAVHSVDFTRDADEVKILSITGNKITVDKSLGFTPIAGDKIESRGNTDLDGYLFL